MSSANPFKFFGGLIIETGAVFAVLYVLWPLHSADVRPALQPDEFFAARPVQYSSSPTADFDDLLPPAPQFRPAAIRQSEPPLAPNYSDRNHDHHWREAQRILPRTPVPFGATNTSRGVYENHDSQDFRQQDFGQQRGPVAVAQPHVRQNFRTDAQPARSHAVAPIRAYYPNPEYRTADVHGEYYNRY